MKPLRLHIQGLTSYREPVDIDFSDLDLFAITGPTGAGKSSLVDAITYALFGQVPRVGRNVKELISPGADRLNVSLEFSSNGGRYRIHRASSRKGAAPSTQLERLDVDGEWKPEEVDRAKEATQFVEQLLGMDYDSFVRSVLLPQGQFQQFLAGEPEQRRKVLDGLLRLDVYGRMMQRANQIAERHSLEAESLRQLLESQFAQATPAALREAKERLKELAGRAQELTALREGLEGACRTAEAASVAMKRAQEASVALAAAQDGLKQARGLLATGQKTIEELAERLAAAEKQVAASAYDADLYGQLREALMLAQRLDKDEGRLEQLKNAIRGREELLQKGAGEAEAAGVAVEQARSAVALAESNLENSRRRDLAAHLRTGLAAGDPCPVCGQKIGMLPAAEHIALDEVQLAFDRAREAERAAQSQAQEAEKRVAVLEQEIGSLRGQITDIQEDCENGARQLSVLMPGERAPAGAIAVMVREQESARKQRQSLEHEATELRSQRDALTAEMANAGKDLARYEAQVESAGSGVESAEAEVKRGEALLRGSASENGWSDVAQALEAGRDAAPLLRARLNGVQRENEGVHQAAGACEGEIKRTQEAMEKAKELRAREKDAREAGSLAKGLASLLRVDRFQAFVREQALRVLAEDGSRRLRDISGGRYDFAVEGQDFLVADQWNAGEKRSVKTLSGGETFLASLALALALAERLPQLSAASGATRLESLFIDEGFSYLDEETLDVVATALEVLGADRDRLVGVITHVAALAERMPARITVVKAQAGSTVVVG